jgi:hypothetical protein
MQDLASAFIVIFALGFAIGYGVRENMSRKRHRRKRVAHQNIFAKSGTEQLDTVPANEATSNTVGDLIPRRAAEDS